MEWVETTGRTLEEARDAALDMLGVDESDAEFLTVTEPRPGLFGRLRGEARVRARVMPTTPPPKRNRGRRPPQRRGSSGSERRRDRVGGSRQVAEESCQYHFDFALGLPEDGCRGDRRLWIGQRSFRCRFRDRQVSFCPQKAEQGGDREQCERHRLGGIKRL